MAGRRFWAFHNGSIIKPSSGCRLLKSNKPTPCETARRDRERERRERKRKKEEALPFADAFKRR
jgi:hypothetical protein